jgi:hypothetical protein
LAGSSEWQVEVQRIVAAQRMQEILMNTSPSCQAVRITLIGLRAKSGEDHGDIEFFVLKTP